MAFLYTFQQFENAGIDRSGAVQQVWRYTSDTKQFMDTSGNVYLPAIIAHDALDLSSEKSSGQVTIKTARDFPVALLWRTGTPAGAVWVDVVQQASMTPAYSGRVLNCSRGEAEAKLLTATLLDILQRTGMRLFWQDTCGWPLYSTKCGVAKDAQVLGAYSWRNDATLTVVSDDGLTLTSPDFATRANGWFVSGRIEWNGQTRMATQHTSSTVKLLAAFTGLTAGAAVIARKGCNKGLGAGGCGDFDNVANYGGCPNVPKKNDFIKGLL